MYALRGRTDSFLLCQIADGWQLLVLPQFPADDLALDLRVNLVVDRRSAFVVDEEIHRLPSLFNCIYTVYTINTDLSRGFAKFPKKIVQGLNNC